MPKSAGSGKKLSKSEKEKLKKEEEAKKLQEEEDARLQAEKEAAANEERLKEENEERRRLENEERQRRKGQLTELEDIWNSIQKELEEKGTGRRVKAKWDRYMLCDGSPDPTIPGEINTFMNLWRENNENNDIHSVLRESDLVLKLLDELEFILKDTPKKELSEKLSEQYKETILELQTLLREKLDLASHDMFLKATDLADQETGNLQSTVSNGVVTLCSWGNITKNTRLKSHEFGDLGFTFDIPRILMLADCGVCIHYTKFDHLSAYSKTYHPRIKAPEEPAEETSKEEKPEEKQEGEGEGGNKGEGEEGGEENKEEGEGEENKEDEEELNRETTEDLIATLHGEEPKKDEDEEEKKEEEAEPMEEDYDIPTPEPIDYDDFDGDDDAVDLRSNTVLGGIYNFSLVHLPPQPKIAKSWSMTLVAEPNRMNPMEYLADAAVIQLPVIPKAAPVDKKEKDKSDEDDEETTETEEDTTETEGEQEKEKEKEKEKPEEKKPATPAGDEKTKKDDRPLLNVVIRLPRDVYFCEEPQVVRWDADNRQWSLNGFSDNYYNEENRVLSFKTTHFSTLALIQDTHINMPFQSWELRPHAINSSIFTIIAAIVEIEIEIKGDLCSYNVQDDKPELYHLKDQWMPAEQLIKALKQGGMNVFPSEDSYKYVSIQDKNRATEDRLYQQMALTSSCMAYSWSKWNSEIKEKEKVVLQGAEHLQDEPLMEEDWSLFLVTKKRTTKLRMTEFDSPFSEDYAEGTEFHADLYHMTKDIVSETSQERLNNTSTEYINTIHVLLNATRPITYS